MFRESRRSLLSQGEEQDDGERRAWVSVTISQLAEQALGSTFPSLGSRRRSHKDTETFLPGLLNQLQGEQEELIPLSAPFSCQGNSSGWCSAFLNSAAAAALEAPRHSQQSLDGCFGDNLGSI